MAPPKQAEICHMFDRIARTYDTVNRVLSWGQDRQWRKAVARKLPPRSDLCVLDIATGTADLLVTLQEAHGNARFFGIDLSANMLALAQDKIKIRGLEQQIHLQVADACALPFESQTFDVVTIAFGIRNITNMTQAFAEISRVLKPAGKIYILEFSLPTNLIIKYSYLVYFRYWLPLVGGLISGEREAYQYLNQTVERFPEPRVFSEILRAAGFTNIQIHALSGGIATLYSAGIS